MTTKKFESEVTAEQLIDYHREAIAKAEEDGDAISIKSAKSAQWHGLFAFIVGPGWDLAREVGIDTSLIAGEIDRIAKAERDKALADSSDAVRALFR